jgi:uracil phosphoribosyltransferase
MLTIVNHPLLKRDLTLLRAKETPHGLFRKVIADAATILAYEAMREVRLREIKIETPLEETTGYELADNIWIVPILRAGLGFVDGFTRYIPEAHIGHIGLYRDEKTKKPVDYYLNLPPNIESAHIFLVDPMLATGGSAIGAVDILKDRGAKDICFVCLVAAPEGVEALQQAHPDVPIVTASLDRELNANMYICPGLGDAGDRIFGT